MKNTNYTIEYWNGLQDVWKPATNQVFTDLDRAKEVMKAHFKMTDYAVDFQIVEVAV